MTLRTIMATALLLGGALIVAFKCANFRRIRRFVRERREYEAAVVGGNAAAAAFGVTKLIEVRMAWLLMIAVLGIGYLAAKLLFAPTEEPDPDDAYRES